MRRKEKQITDPDLLQDIIHKAKVCRIALADNNIPYIVPVCFGHRDGCLFFHSAPEGRKIDMLRSNPTVCFEMEVDTEVVRGERPCKWTMQYQSLIGYGKASILEQPQAKKEALDVIMDHYGAGPELEYREAAVDKIVIVKIEVQSLTGKKSG